MSKYRRFTNEEVAIIQRLYRKVPVDKIVAMIPGKNKQAIFALACRMRLTKPRKRDAPERFWEKVNKNSGIFGEDDWYDFGECWIWEGGLFSNGYGQFKLSHCNTKIGAHRFAYQDIIGPIPDGLVLDHLCRIRACVNPTHLQPVTTLINMLRGQLKYSHCLFGHVRTHFNTIKVGVKLYCKSCGMIQDHSCMEHYWSQDLLNENYYTRYINAAKN